MPTDEFPANTSTKKQKTKKKTMNDGYALLLRGALIYEDDGKEFDTLTITKYNEQQFANHYSSIVTSVHDRVIGFADEIGRIDIITMDDILSNLDYLFIEENSDNIEDSYIISMVGFVTKTDNGCYVYSGVKEDASGISFDNPYITIYIYAYDNDTLKVHINTCYGHYTQYGEEEIERANISEFSNNVILEHEFISSDDYEDEYGGEWMDKVIVPKKIGFGYFSLETIDNVTEITKEPNGKIKITTKNPKTGKENSKFFYFSSQK